MEGLLQSEEDSYFAESASRSYSSVSIIATDDCKIVDTEGMHLEPLGGSRHLSTGRMDQEDFQYEEQTGFFSGDSERKEEPSKSRPVLAPDSSINNITRGALKYYFRLVYEENELIDLECIPYKKVREAIIIVLPAILKHYDPRDPLKPDRIPGCNRIIKLLVFMRKDQYVKKAWSKIKTLIYYRYKRPKMLKTNAHELLKRELEFDQDHDAAFENLFGSGTCDGLKVESIEYILCNQSLFNCIFNEDFFIDLREELNNQTLKDIETNLLKKLDRFLSGEKGGWEESAGYFSKKRSVKTPFTFLENNTSLIILVDRFIKQLNKTTAITEANKLSHMRKLTSLRRSLCQYAEINNWTLPGCKFKKSEIISFLF